MRLRGVQEQALLAPRSARLPRAAACASALLGLGLWALLRSSPTGGYLGALGCGLGLWEVCAQISYTWAPLERLTPKVLSGNVIATLAPSGKARGNAVLLAHLDTQTTPVYSRSKVTAGASYALLYLGLAVLLLTAAALILSAPAGVALPLWAGAPGALLAAAMLAAMVHSHLPPMAAGPTTTPRPWGSPWRWRSTSRGHG